MSQTDWRTPARLFEMVNLAVGGFKVDAAADGSNHLVDLWYGLGSPLGEDALQVEKWLSPAWCNPPYGKGIEKWLDKFIEQGKIGNGVVALLPANIETRWWYEKVYGAGAGILFLVGRVIFERPCPECGGSGRNQESFFPCMECKETGAIPVGSPRFPSALAFYGPHEAGVDWVEWKK